MPTRFEIRNLTGTEWEGALKDALIARRDGTISHEVDDLLGIMVSNLTKWGVRDAIRKGTLYVQAQDDIDFMCDMRVALLSKLDRVDLERHPRQIIGYLKRTVDNAIVSRLRYDGRLKRVHEDVSLEDTELAADFFGNILKE